MSDLESLLFWIPCVCVCVHCNPGIPMKKVGPFLGVKKVGLFFGVGPKHKNGQVAKKEIFFRQALSINSTHF